MAVAAAVLLSSGCASITSPARKSQLVPGHGYWFDYDASRRGTVFAVDQNGGIRTCAEPAPDVAMQMAANAHLDVKSTGSTSAAAGGTAAQAARVLSERTQMVMFFREALFRVCEISLNQNLDSAHVVKLYEYIIHTALKLGSDKAFEVELLQARVDLEQRIADRESAKANVERLTAELAVAKDALDKQKIEADLHKAVNAELAAREEVLKAAAQLTGLPAEAPPTVQSSNWP